jgi:AraC-like DNA-binding protein
VICGEIGLPPHKKKWLESKFREKTGTTIGHYFRDIQMLAALKLYAITEAPRRDKERARKTKLKEMKVKEQDLVKALDDPKLTEKERKKIGELLEESPKGTFLTQIAKSLGFGKPGKELDNFDKRIISRLGVNISDLKGQSDFFYCEVENSG